MLGEAEGFSGGVFGENLVGGAAVFRIINR